MQCLGSVGKGRCVWIHWKAFNTSSRKVAQQSIAKHLNTDSRIFSYVGTPIRREKKCLVLSSGCQGIHGKNDVSTTLQKLKTDDGDDMPIPPPFHSLISETSVPLFLTKLNHLCEHRIISANHFSFFAYQLQGIVYNQLYNEFPWLYKNTSFAFKQLTLNRKSNDCFTPLFQNPHTQNFRSYVEDEVDNIPPQDCAHILLSFIYIGEPLDSTFVHRMLDRIFESDSVFDVNDLSSIVKVLGMFPRPHKKLLELIFCQLDKVFKDDFIDKKCDMSLKSVCNILMNLFPYYSDDFCALGTAYALKIARSKRELKYSDVSTCLRMLFRILIPQNLQNVDGTMSDQPEYMKNLRELENIIYDNLPQYIDKFTGKDFATFSKSYRFLGKVEEDVFKRLNEKRSQIFHQSDTSITELADVIRLISRPCSSQTYHRLNMFIIERMEEVDVITLSRFCNKILEFKLYNMEVKAKFEKKVTEVLDLLSDYSAVDHLHKVLFVATKWRSPDAIFVNRFSSKLIELLNGQHGFNPFTVCVIFSYLLCSLQEEFPYHLLEKLLTAIPKVQIPTLSNLLMIINQNQMAANFSHAMEIKSALLAALKDRATTTPTTSILSQLKLALRSSPTDNLLAEALSNLPQITKNMSQNDFVQLCHTFKLLNYHYQEVYADMENYFLENFRSLDKGNVADLVQGYSQNGYKPIHFEEFSEKCCQTARLFLHNCTVFESVAFLFDLSRMQIFSDECLSHVFTLEYMKHIDETDQNGGGSLATKNDLMKMQLAHLNQCVVIECPQLNIPLFYKDGYSSVINQDNGQQSTFYRNVRLILNQVLGGSQYYGTFVKSPYSHDIFFECILDNYETLMTYKKEDMLFPNSDFKRVAILLWSRRNYCLHSHHLIGNSIMLKRHLEIMGYKVAEVPYYEWFSMALTDTVSKENYLHNKIFN